MGSGESEEWRAWLAQVIGMARSAPLQGKLDDGQLKRFLEQIEAGGGGGGGGGGGMQFDRRRAVVSDEGGSA